MPETVVEPGDGRLMVEVFEILVIFGGRVGIELSMLRSSASLS